MKGRVTTAKEWPFLAIELQDCIRIYLKLYWMVFNLNANSDVDNVNMGLHFNKYKNSTELVSN